jgi:hypothetical protein
MCHILLFRPDKDQGIVRILQDEALHTEPWDGGCPCTA